jgi:predicted nuclease of restriction endonuclease-like (RecB) superfamily
MNVLSLLSGVPTAIATYVTRRMEIKAEDRQQERAIKKALTERQLSLIEQGLHADMQWELEMAKQAASSWKDEYVLILVSIPAVVSFLSERGAERVQEGFGALEKMPTWYQIVFVSVLLATYGIRWWRRSQSDT